jgi:hypothetical protein
MASGTSKPQVLTLPHLASIHAEHPAIGKTLQQILEYINKNVVPIQGNLVAPAKKTAGGNS